MKGFNAYLKLLTLTLLILSLSLLTISLPSAYAKDEKLYKTCLQILGDSNFLKITPGHAIKDIKPYTDPLSREFLLIEKITPQGETLLGILDIEAQHLSVHSLDSIFKFTWDRIILRNSERLSFNHVRRGAHIYAQIAQLKLLPGWPQPYIGFSDAEVDEPSRYDVKFKKLTNKMGLLSAIIHLLKNPNYLY